MSILCFVTDKVRDDVTSHGISEEKLNRFAKEVEAKQSLASFDHFPPPCLTRKKLFGYNFRLIAVEKYVQSHVVIVLLRLVVRGSHEYAKFMENSSVWAERQFAAAISDQTLSDWVLERTAIPLSDPLPLLSESEEHYLWSNAWEDRFEEDGMICETARWLDDLQSAQVDSRLILIPDMILQSLEMEPGKIQTISSRQDPKLKLVSHVVPNTRQYLLMKVGYDESAESLRDFCEDWQGRLAEANAEAILRHSRRSYPAIICGDPDLWITIQKDPQANLALSPEEAEILRTATSAGDAGTGFPLFINGRAGSGKSTLLQYLFAECLVKWNNHLGSDAKCRPLYLASSPTLLSVAREVVGHLLKANHKSLLGGSSATADDGGCFQETVRFLRSFLGDEADNRFPLAGHVGYARFRQLWTDRFGKEKKAVREYGPQVSWHVIRGIIKGMSVDGILEKEDYDDLPTDERSISRFVFESVYDKVWLAWYKPLHKPGGIWDTQDLVRYLLDQNQIHSTHVAVFCDEAQDFTRLELEAFYRCSVFSNRQLDLQSLKRIPFVFAGDPFQTLNPTGFRWESVRAAFTERIVRSLYRFVSRAEMPQLNYRELTYNYRSSERIVHFCNSIQALRARSFEHRTLRPQSLWQSGEPSSPPCFFEKGDVRVGATLREQSDLVFIIPCEEGEELEYVAADDYLKSIVQHDSDGTPRNVLSASRAKGLEFLRIAIYGWSEREEAGILAKRVRTAEAKPPTQDERLGLEYYLNNLYVAASRARRRLFVIEKRDSLNGLWWFVADEQHLAQCLEGMPNADAWKANTGLLAQGVLENFEDDRDDPRVIAERFEREGQANGDNYLLKQAGLQYAIAGNEAKASECRARAELGDGRYREAGDYFSKANLFEEAISSYWRGKHFAHIQGVAIAKPEFARRPECRVAEYLTAQAHSIRTCLLLFEQLDEYFQQPEVDRKSLRSDHWRDAVEASLTRSTDRAASSDDPSRSRTTSDLADQLERFEQFGLKIDPTYRSRFLVESGRYEEALKLIPDEHSDLYREAKARVLIGPSGTPSDELTPLEKRIVADFHLRKKDYESAARLFAALGDSTSTFDCLQGYLRANATGNPGRMIDFHVASLVAQADWESLIEFLERGSPPSGPRNPSPDRQPLSKKILDHIRRDRIVFKSVIPRLARSEELSRTVGKAQIPVSDFLEAQLVKSAAQPNWTAELSRFEAGAAIERAGRDVDALRFYEWWMSTSSAREDRDHADRRWIVCKLRQARREDRDGHEKSTNRYRQDAQKVLDKHGWKTPDDLDAFPTLPPLSHEGSTGTDSGGSRPNTGSRTEPPPSLSGKIGLVSYRVISDKGWVNLQADDGLCARILVRDRTAVSTDIHWMHEEDCLLFSDWGLTVRWLSDKKLALTHQSKERIVELFE